MRNLVKDSSDAVFLLGRGPRAGLARRGTVTDVSHAAASARLKVAQMVRDALDVRSVGGGEVGSAASTGGVTVQRSVSRRCARGVGIKG